MERITQGIHKIKISKSLGGDDHLLFMWVPRNQIIGAGGNQSSTQGRWD